MRNFFFQNLISNKSDNKSDNKDCPIALAEKMEHSQLILNEAAQRTIELAKDITTALHEKLDDCLTHITSTNNIVQDALIVTDATGIIQTINQSAERIFGFTDAMIAGSHITALLSLEQSVTLRSNFTMEGFTKEANGTADIESFMGRRKNNSLFYISVSSNMVTKKNKISYYIVIIRDETAKMENSRNLIESEQRFKAFSDASCEAMLIHNQEQILHFNKRLLDFTGFSAEEISSFKPIYLFISEDQQNLSVKSNSEMLEKYESTIRSKNGRLIAVAVTSKPITWEGNKARMKVLQDISAEHDKEKYIEYTKNKNQKIVDATDLICCFNNSFVITFANQAFWEYLNLEQREVIGKSILDFISEEDKQELFKNITNLTNENPVFQGSHSFQINNDVSWHDSVNRGIYDDDGKFIEYQSVTKSAVVEQPKKV
jgi:PAS domain S-box-containing protein